MEMEERTLQITTILTQAPVYLQATGLFLLRYGLAAMMLLFGLQKWTKAEAEGILPWVSHSPLNVLALSCDLGSGCVRSHRRSRTGDCRESRCS